MSLQAVPRSVGIWLSIGLFMVFIQILIGGITRLTDSGLSITEWELVKGVLPPLNQEDWQDAFEKYQEHTLQAEVLHANMSLQEFKFIYFWEWFHRLWGRIMGFVFLFPFLYFWRKGYFNKLMMGKLGILVLLAGLAAVFGWIMVASGLNTEQYVWVNPFNLTLHLSIALSVIAYLWWLNLQVYQPFTQDAGLSTLKKIASIFIVLLVFQILMGGMVAGTKAGLLYRHFPGMEQAYGGFIPVVLTDFNNWTSQNFFGYAHVGEGNNAFTPALVQFIHRLLAYGISLFALFLAFKTWASGASARSKTLAGFVILSVFVQVLLGIYTILLPGGKLGISPWLGVAHQGCAIILLLFAMALRYQFSSGGKELLREQANKPGDIDYTKGVIIE
jgi:cytochrome c oxidase assembly protein subunit 15